VWPDEAAAISSKEFVAATAVDLSSAESLSRAAAFTVLQFGGIDGIVNTAAIYPVPDASGRLTDGQWSKTFLVNVTGNYLLGQETQWIFQDQQLPAGGGADGLGERGRVEERQRSLRHEQERR
jgi:NAD(P)-dependent dehydrogenase (short-subunit alcohol dehydrogenase family)